jgi:hypothetical protein
MDFLSKILFLANQYLWLLILITSAFGLGQLAIGSFISRMYLPPILSGSMNVAMGLGLIVVTLFLLGSLGHLTSSSVYLLLCLGLLGTVFAFLQTCQGQWRSCLTKSEIRTHLRQHWFWFSLLAISIAPLLIRPLQIPLSWDELMYHLPLARTWAEQGYLVVDPWIRYPLFPYNYNLLYAAAFLVADDVFTHLLHMLAGLLVALVLFGASQRWFDWRAGIIAAILLIATVKSQFETAYIDLGVMLFLSIGFTSLGLAHESRNNHWLYLSGFFTALAVGTKYQGLFYLPVYGLLVLMIEQRLRVLFLLTLIILVTGGYWYIRNWVISGDPIHPIGGPWFGFWLWDQGDLEGQFADFVYKKRLPEWYLLIGLFAVLFLQYSSSILKGLYLAALASLVVWWFASGYRRYLTPALPLLALLSAVTIIKIYDATRIGMLISNLNTRLSTRFRMLLSLVVIVAGSTIAFNSARPYWDRIATDSVKREVLLEELFGSYAILRDFGGDEQLWPIYQLGFEGELYHSPVPLIGDWFGPGRYREVLRRASDGSALAEHLRDLGAGGLLVNRQRPGFSKFPQLDLDNKYFALVGRTDHADLYRLLER